MASEMARVIKLSPPDTLPPDTYSSADFKVWRSHATTFLTQNSENCMFLKGGDYEVWEPQITCLPNKRITELKGDDLRYPSRAQIKALAMVDADPGLLLRIWLKQGKERILLARILEILEKVRKRLSRQNSSIKVRKCEEKKT